ncbi:uncharacterized protein LOC123553281 [Mercenaria mercenaria]|uniref:uncharacterized protein LOC123553281 n=1 Tax=Mercenaria mercenaria TaxID=6596 RepID=UPI00234E5EF3|nr:uncharacterized protein LOC123553281 [Mercenaria mercenaria]
MFRTIVLTISCVSLVTAISWSDCSTDPTHDAVTFTHIDASPSRIVFPGDLHINLNLTFNRPIEHALLDIEFYRYILGFPLKIPCINGTIIGSCNNIDACRIFRSILNDPNHQGDYGHQAESIMLHALGHYMQCPLKAETVIVDDAVAHLDPVPSVLGVLADGNYVIIARAKEKVGGPYTLGCIRLQVSIGLDTSAIIG